MTKPPPLIASSSLPCLSPSEADATLLKKPEKLLAGSDRGGPPSAPVVPRRRGSMPVPYKHQLRRAQAVDELDWPPQASSSGSSDSLGSGEAASAPKDGIFKVMLVGESGVGKSTLAGTFGGLQGDGAHELENTGMQELRVGCGMMRYWSGMEVPHSTSSNWQTEPGVGEFPIPDGLPFPYFPTEETYERRITVDKEEVTLIVYDIWGQVRTKMWL